MASNTVVAGLPTAHNRENLSLTLLTVESQATTHRPPAESPVVWTNKHILNPLKGPGSVVDEKLSQIKEDERDVMVRNPENYSHSPPTGSYGEELGNGHRSESQASATAHAPVSGSKSDALIPDLSVLRVSQPTSKGSTRRQFSKKAKAQYESVLPINPDSSVSNQTGSTRRQFSKKAKAQYNAVLPINPDSSVSSQTENSRTYAIEERDTTGSVKGEKYDTARKTNMYPDSAQPGPYKVMSQESLPTPAHGRAAVPRQHNTGALSNGRSNWHSMPAGPRTSSGDANDDTARGKATYPLSKKTGMKAKAVTQVNSKVEKRMTPAIQGDKLRSKGLGIGELNVNSLLAKGKNKMREVKLLREKYDLDIFVLVRSWLPGDSRAENELKENLHVDNFTFVRADGKNSKGGLIVYLNKNISYDAPVEWSDHDKVQLLEISITKPTRLHLVAIYITENKLAMAVITRMKEILQRKKTEGIPVMFIGDLNIDPDRQQDARVGRALDDLDKEFSTRRLIDSPTHDKYCIDHIITNIPERLMVPVNPMVIPTSETHTGVKFISNHNLILCRVKALH